MIDVGQLYIGRTQSGKLSWRPRKQYTTTTQWGIYYIYYIVEGYSYRYSQPHPIHCKSFWGGRTHLSRFLSPQFTLVCNGIEQERLDQVRLSQQVRLAWVSSDPRALLYLRILFFPSSVCPDIAIYTVTSFYLYSVLLLPLLLSFPVISPSSFHSTDGNPRKSHYICWRDYWHCHVLSVDPTHVVCMHGLITGTASFQPISSSRYVTPWQNWDPVARIITYVILYILSAN